MRRDSRWFVALALIAVAAGSRPASALARARTLPDPVDAGYAQATGPAASSPAFEAPRLRATTARLSRRVVEAHLVRVRRGQGAGPGNLLAPSVEIPSLAAIPESPLQLLPSAACVQDRLDRCTRSPRPPPQV